MRAFLCATAIYVLLCSTVSLGVLGMCAPLYAEPDDELSLVIATVVCGAGIAAVGCVAFWKEWTRGRVVQVSTEAECLQATIRSMAIELRTAERDRDEAEAERDALKAEVARAWDTAAEHYATIGRLRGELDTMTKYRYVCVVEGSASSDPKTAPGEVRRMCLGEPTEGLTLVSAIVSAGAHPELIRRVKRYDEKTGEAIWTPGEVPGELIHVLGRDPREDQEVTRP